MRLIITGCEYSGKTTLLEELKKWAKKEMGGLRSSGHDHFVYPKAVSSDEEREKMMALPPAIKEQFQRYEIYYHLHPDFLRSNDHVMVGFHIEEAVYAPLYYEYGRPGEYADRAVLARMIERDLLEIAPDMVLVLMKASREEIVKRMKEKPHMTEVIKEKDVESVLKNFDDEYEKSLITRKFVLDTTGKTIEETFNQFLKSMEPHFTLMDNIRMIRHKLSALP